MNEAESIQLMTLVDKIYQDEKTINEKEKVNSDYEIIELDKNISNVESILLISILKMKLNQQLIQMIYQKKLCNVFMSYLFISMAEKQLVLKSLRLNCH